NNKRFQKRCQAHFLSLSLYTIDNFNLYIELSIQMQHIIKLCLPNNLEILYSIFEYTLQSY
ncbi:MAG: hypothetical protein ABF470_09455, partial [Liquorilactobacillus sp.]|uniref:hypothetical protein n=1 Tax=Liquorilactobacillus sp. TaxID=2767923 RepID=UPI0039E834B9